MRGTDGAQLTVRKAEEPCVGLLNPVRDVGRCAEEPPQIGAQPGLVDEDVLCKPHLPVEFDHAPLHTVSSPTAPWPAWSGKLRREVNGGSEASAQRVIDGRRRRAA